MRVSVIDYGSGNLASAARALAETARRRGIAADIGITHRAADIAASDRIVLPGQGAFADCAAGLASLWPAIEAFARSGRPFLGICVGMQLMAERGLEHEITAGFGWIGGEIARLEAPGLRLPHMGWNALEFHAPGHHLLRGLAPGAEVYFVHSYGLRAGDPAQVIASTDYGGAVPAMVARGNVAGTQFHVEKSQETGLQILANFLDWSP